MLGVQKTPIDFHSTSFIVRTLLRLIPDYSVERINKKGWFYDDYISAINYYAPTVLNFLIDSFLEPRFGATCLSDK
ncbi:Hypothetical protein PHPALM_15941 [Phytophthora palmivora]|uniref:Uncharacterized protein n=1 Tax=Phytophthora palmivora TaxID=4796 RepID=A0A2P4XR02_9STRA|nr:Hypothetical protein PHPALM_15941 [Phytophthora palmivora]